MWWQVKDSNLRSFRDGFTDLERQARDQRKRPSPQQLPPVFPPNNRQDPATAGHPRRAICLNRIEPRRRT
jgi:hypothetical protein